MRAFSDGFSAPRLNSEPLLDAKGAGEGDLAEVE